MAKNQYPKDLVQRVRGNRDRQHELEAERQNLGTDLEKAESYLILSKGQLDWKEKLSGGVRKWLNKPTPALQQVWDAKENIGSLEQAISATRSHTSTLASDTNNAIRGYLMDDSPKYRELDRYTRVSYEALNDASSYLRLVRDTAHGVESLVRMVLRDWPDFKNPWKRRPQPPCPPRRPCPPRQPPFRIMDDEELEYDDADWDTEDWGDMPDLGVFGNLTDIGTLTRELEADIEEVDDEMSMDLYDPDVPDFSEVPDLHDPRRRRRPRQPCPPAPCPPKETWGEYWRNTARRRWALEEAQNGVEKVKGKKRSYTSTMRRYASRRPPESGALPYDYDHALSGVQSSYIDNLAWFNMFHPLLFLYNMERVGRQLRHLESYVAEVKPYIQDDYTHFETEKSLLVSRVREDILSD